MISDIIGLNGKQQNKLIVSYDNTYVTSKRKARCGVTLMTGIRKRVIPAQNLTECFPRLQRKKASSEMSTENK